MAFCVKKASHPCYLHKLFSILLIPTQIILLNSQVHVSSSTSISMNATSSSKWAWDLDKPHNCNVEQIPLSKLSLRFPPHGLVPPLYHEPFVIIDDGSDELKRNKFFQDKSSIAGISDSLGSSFPITLSSSNSFSDHRRTTSLSQYINDTIHSETLPQHLSNETWYVVEVFLFINYSGNVIFPQ